ncbi:MAG: archaeal proteasome endopeptidase complex subunit alpha [Candidatus Thermoplasmatota archaeon]|nr:archaeal proteasome endopeptidase complex subunit alpha [Candidatus Thermoplasmatota archaeon]
MRMKPGQMGYDRGITVFSPDGRLFQVEYAREAVSRGTTTVGIKVKDGVALVVDKDVPNKLVEPQSIEKIYKIDKKIGIATSGLVADSRILVDHARVSAQVNRVSYNERINVRSLVKKICDYKQTYTQYGGVRPFGTALLVAGTDEEGTHLYETDPSGANMAYKAVSIGSNRDEVQEVFSQEYEEDLTLDEGIELSLKGLKRAREEGLESRSLDIGIITEDEDFRKLSIDEIEEYLSSV